MASNNTTYFLQFRRSENVVSLGEIQGLSSLFLSGGSREHRFPASPNLPGAARTPGLTATKHLQISILPLPLPPASSKDPCDYLEPTWITQDSLALSRSLVTSAKSLLPREVMSLRFPGTRMRTWLEAIVPPTARASPPAPRPLGLSQAMPVMVRCVTDGGPQQVGTR